MKKVNNVRIGPSGKAMIVEGSNEFLVKRGSTSHREGRQKWGHLNPYKKLLRSISEAARAYPRYIFWAG